MNIIISGKGGQGVKFMGIVLGEIMTRLKYEVALTFDFDAAVRGGDSTAFLKFSKDKIENPIVEKADILVKLSDKDYPAEKVIKDIQGRPTNMHALGIILKEIGAAVTEEIVRDALPERNMEDNLAVIMEHIQ